MIFTTTDWITLLSGSGLPLIIGCFVWLYKKSESEKRIKNRVAILLYEAVTHSLSALKKDSQELDENGYFNEENIESFKGIDLGKWSFFLNFEDYIYRSDVSDSISNKLISFRIKMNKILSEEKDYFEFLYRTPEYELKTSITAAAQEEAFFTYKQHQTALLIWEFYQYSIELRPSNKEIDPKELRSLNNRHADALKAKIEHKYLI